MFFHSSTTGTPPQDTTCQCPLPEWTTSDTLVPYPEAVAHMEEQVHGIIAGTAPELIWLLEHPPLYTAGSSAQDKELLNTQPFPVYTSGRGGRYTYHGPGQRIGYVMLDLNRRIQDVRAYVHAMEEWLILTLAHLGVVGERRQDRIGIWVRHSNGREEKIAALGIRIKKWVTFHGFALNVCPNLDHFSGIVPCGLDQYGVTSLQALGTTCGMRAVDDALRITFQDIFGKTSQGPLRLRPPQPIGTQ